MCLLSYSVRAVSGHLAISREIARGEVRLKAISHASARLRRGTAALNVYAKRPRHLQLPIRTICDNGERSTVVSPQLAQSIPPPLQIIRGTNLNRSKNKSMTTDSIENIKI
jgi:hypothetical protein